MVGKSKQVPLKFWNFKCPSQPSGKKARPHHTDRSVCLNQHPLSATVSDMNKNAASPLPVLALLGSLLFAACSTAPETGRSQLVLLPEAQVDSMAAQGFSQMKQQLTVSTDPEKNAQLQRVGERIVNAARARGANIPPASQWEFVVFEDDAVNAFAMPGGKVGFYTGIFPLFESDDDLAVVMGHEVAHVTAGHGRERVSHQLATQMAGLGLALGLGASRVSDSTADIALAAFGAGTSVGILLPFGRHQESEADHIGLIYSASAGYDPRNAVPFWERMGGAGGASPPEFLSTHPNYQTRIRRLQQLMPEVMPLYERSRSDQAWLGPVYPENTWASYTTR